MIRPVTEDAYKPRVSYQNYHDIYFWTATIHDWIHLLKPDHYKDIIVDSIRTLVSRRLAEVFGFVIMPNHIHLIWRILGLNGKESPQGSLLKFTAHQFRRRLLAEAGWDGLIPFAVNAANKELEFWRRDSMAIRLFDLPIAIQKLGYLHSNPLQDHWRLVSRPEDYRYSSARYYKTGHDDFGFLSNLYDAFEFGH